VLDQKSYINTVVNILKDEGLYRNYEPTNIVMKVNRRICTDFQKDISVIKCANKIAHDVFGRVS
jgi:hypothetical protein